MIDPNQNTNENFRQIEDIIDARKLLGQYNVHKQSNGMNLRYIYSSSTGTSQNHKTPNVDDTVLNDIVPNLKPTDSEITIVRVRCDDINPKIRQNKWDMHDIAIPGDGSHLGESPSLVNLATLVGHNVPCEGEEYLVPLSSWDPYLKSEDVNPDLKCCSELNFESASCSYTQREKKISIESDLIVKMHGIYRSLHVKQMHSNGTSAYGTFVAILPSSLVTFITVLLISVLSSNFTIKKKWQFLIEYIFLVVPIILNITILAEHLQIFLLTLLVAAAIFVVVVYNVRPSKSSVKNNVEFQTNYLTNARSTINILTVAAILAVDFKVFPRYFAKTESFGYSLMDVGVGLFMFSNGIVAPEARGYQDSVKKCIKSSLPLFILGIARLIFVKQTDYNVSVSEYGVHWNFFITLGITKVICTFVFYFIKVRFLFIHTVFMITLHETLLQKGLQKFTLTDATRDNLLTSNKEGLVSSLGYVCIYLFSVSFGRFLHSKSRSKKMYIVLKFFIYSFSALALSVILKSYFGVSRKLANSAYCFWVMFIGMFMTGLYYSLQIFLEFLYKNRLRGTFSPLIFDAINFNGLVFFLVGNLLTGLVNLTFETLTINNYFSLVILAAYMFVNCSIVTLLYCVQYKLKF